MAGGLWVSSLYPDSVESAIEKFKGAKRVVLLPSTVCDCPELLRVLDSRYTVFCRERKTYEYLCEAKTGAELYLDCDMALRLSKKALDLRFWSTGFYAEQINLILNRISEIENIAFLLRNDGEKSFKHIPSDFDLSSVFFPVMTDNESRFVAALMLSVVDEFPTIVTDRLHVGIAAILMGKEVYLLDNSYGKVFSVYRHSFSHMANVHCCRSVEDIQLRNVKYQSNGNLQHLLNALM